MPILLVLFLLAASSSVAWPSPPWNGGAATAVTIMLLAVLLPLAAHAALVLWTLAALKQQRRGLARRYSTLRRLIGLAHLLLSAAAIGLGWGWVVQQRFVLSHDDQPVLAPFAELLVPMPFLAGLLLGWLIHHDAERALHLRAAGLGASFWSRAGNFFNRLRFMALLVLPPMLLLSLQQTLDRFAPATARSTAASVVFGIGLVGFLLLMPLAVRLALGLKRLEGPLRAQLDAFARRLRFRCADLLVWPTHGTLANAMIMGVIPQARYVIFSDRLLRELSDDELQAVYGHEIGHVRHGHIVYYAIFLLLSLTVIFAAFHAAALELHARGWLSAAQVESTWISLAPFALLGLHFYLVFGLLSRKCERQADLYGVAAVAAMTDQGCPHARGVYAMTRALEKVALLNGMDNTFADSTTSWFRRLRARLTAWQHGAIGDRIDFLFRTLNDPDLIPRTHRRINAFRWLLLLALLAALVGIIGWLGPANFVAML